jgi:8-oxo-dGTP pyrophosphatase MutT (NUDIX family)
VCYRVKDHGVEFLLVRTRGGKWTFPKGSVEPGLTNAQSAALEAFEEAGVHGRIEEASFARYPSRKRRGRRDSSTPGFVISAHLCEVMRLVRPKEAKRNPTWFSAEKAKLRLQRDRAPKESTELLQVVDRAVNRIRRLHAPRAVDALQKVQFEIPTRVAIHRLIQTAGFFPRAGGEDGGRKQTSPVQIAFTRQLCKVLQFAATQGLAGDGRRLLN